MKKVLKFESEDSEKVIYSYKTDYDKLYVTFYKLTKQVDISHMMFITNSNNFEPQESDWGKHSCKYGHWEVVSSATLGQGDIEYLYEKCKEIFEK